MTPQQRSNLRAALAVLLTIALLAPVVATGRSARAIDAAQRAEDDLEATRATALRLQDLLRRQASVGDRPSPEPDLVARLHNTLHLTGVSPDHLTRISAQAPSPIRGADLSKQVVAITVEPIRAPDLARWLNQWTRSEPLWTIRSVRLDRQAESQRTQRSGAHDPNPPSDDYAASITLERIHLTNRVSSQETSS
ncbi:MAG: hypothetical protein H6814_09105 [Phycisphaeraceae bacterium]|nr:hypothetical protein [Phycisphaeraceae bacterium]